ncbi:MAG: acyltransferase [Oscillospiraceae bacterium]|nr:acyltransferase [Oscillospiraceae bacterium]
MKRLYFLDNLRWMTVILVIIYHVFYIFNCSGVPSNFTTQGIPCFDAFLAFVYPWFMILMFAIAGCSARYALQKRSGKEFIKDRNHRIFIPCIAGMFAYGWITGYIGFLYSPDAESMKVLPKFVLGIIILLSGTGPLWFGQLLFVICLILMLIRKLDKNQKLLKLGEKANLPVLIALIIPVWLSSMVLIMPYVTIYRLGIYGFTFLLGYYILSHESVQERLAKFAIWLITPAILLGIAVTIRYYGENYAADAVLQSPFINAYAWLMTIALFGLGRKYLNFQNTFTRFMTSRSQSYYLLHYTSISLLGWFCIEKLNLPFGIYYLIIALGTAIFLPLVTELFLRIPVLNRLLLGMTIAKKIKTKKATAGM